MTCVVAAERRKHCMCDRPKQNSGVRLHHGSAFWNALLESLGHAGH